jgi:hypothetical protein
MRRHEAAAVILGLASLASVACGTEGPRLPSSPSGSVTSPTTSQPQPPPGVHTLRGEIADLQSGPVRNASINVWIQTASFGFSYWWANGPLRSDDDGRYVASVPNGQITMLAFKDGYVQPCAVIVDIESDAVLDVEMISVASLEGPNPPRPRTAVGPLLTGSVFEITSEGKTPVVGASLGAEAYFDGGAASTRSERDGHFLLCNLPQRTYLYVSKAGYETWSGTVDGSAPVDIELKRR